MVVFMLAMHPECQDKAYNEMSSVFASKDVDVTIEELQKLVYLDMCIKEALRVFPTVPAIARKATKSIQLRGYKIPSGTAIGIDIFSVHRSKKYWGDDVQQFIPERFAMDKELVHPYCYLAFSHGSRNCIVSSNYSFQIHTSITIFIR